MCGFESGINRRLFNFIFKPFRYTFSRKTHLETFQWPAKYPQRKNKRATYPNRTVSCWSFLWHLITFLLEYISNIDIIILQARWLKNFVYYASIMLNAFRHLLSYAQNYASICMLIPSCSRIISPITLNLYWSWVFCITDNLLTTHHLFITSTFRVVFFNLFITKPLLAVGISLQTISTPQQQNSFS